MVDQISRRKALKLSGGIASTVLVAGCSGNGGEETDEGAAETTEEGAAETTEETTTEMTEETTEETTEGTSTEGAGSGDTSAWEDVETIRMLGNAGGWVGVEPEMIADVENPTIVLFEGNQYEFTWENDDGAGHNIEMHDENGEVVNDYATEIVRGTGETQTLEFEATSDIAQYVCNPHITTMVGDVQIESGSGSGGETETDSGTETETETTA